jgi:hypothetical protein
MPPAAGPATKAEYCLDLAGLLIKSAVHAEINGMNAVASLFIQRHA